MNLGERIELRVESLAHGGRGVARHDGCVVFVALAAPGDLVEAVITKVQKRFAEASVARVLEAGASRREPGCPAFGRCGGCQWLHVGGAAQLEAKDRGLRESLARIGKVTVEQFEPPVGAPPGEEFAYRSRAVLRGRASESGVVLGFLTEGTREVVALPGTCRVLEPILDRAARELAARRWPPGPFKLELTAAGEEAHLLVQGDGDPRAYRRALEGFPCVVLDGRGRVRHEAPRDLRYEEEVTLGARTLRYLLRPGAFSQVHRSQNRRLIAKVLEYAGALQGARVLDLFCGAGNLSLPLALEAAAVTGIDVSPEAVDDARESAKASGLTNCEFLAGDAARVLAQRPGPGPRVAVLDPPRSGAAELMGPLAALGPERIVYVSCNPATLARDAALLASSGYLPSRAVAIDMFPQTYHVEAVLLLERRG